MRSLVFLSSLLVVFACSTEKQTTAEVLNSADYEQYLTDTIRPSYSFALEQFNFWNSRITPDSQSVGDLSPTAGAYRALFQTTGAVQMLHNAEKLYRKGIEISAFNKDNFVRSLVANLISQHRFAEARQLIAATDTLPSNKIQNDLVWFDILMETGDYETAGNKLTSLVDNSDFSYLIRKAKYKDYQGDLDDAIISLESATKLAESSDNTGLRVWSYTNLGDFYGHAGRIEDAYQTYLKALALEPDNAYAKKGLAWIAYAHEGNTEEANRILDAVLVHHQVPDYYLLKAEMAEFKDDLASAKTYHDKFLQLVSDPIYGGMYNTYLVELLSEKIPAKALAIATNEISNRDTPETRQLLALAQWKNGQADNALATLDTYVIDKTSEPMALLHAAQIYKATGKHPERVKMYKSELEEAAFELGPVTFAEVQAL